jgi:superfamily II DNA or RNA helicase
MIIEFDNILARADMERDKNAYEDVRRLTKVMAPGARYMKSYYEYKKSKGKKGWNGLVNILSPKGIFPTGLLPMVLNNLWEQAKIVPTLVDKRQNPGFNPEDITVKLRGYQETTLKKSLYNSFNNLWWPRGIIQLATGGGKTEVAIAIYQTNMVPSLFLVHSRTLGYQTVERFEHYLNQPIGIYFDGNKNLVDNGINVASIQTVLRNENTGECDFLLRNTRQVFFDECHLMAAKVAAGNQFIKISDRMENAFFRWGLTATPFKRDQYSNQLLAGSTGDVLHSETSKDLIDAGYLVPADIEIVEAPKVHKCPAKWPACYDSGIVLNRGRTMLTIDKIEELPKPCFVLCKQIAHATILEHEANRRGIKCAMLQGIDDQNERQRIINEVKKGNLEAVICTTIFDEGFDFPALKSIILAGGGKSEVKAIQRIGRGLRKASGKSKIVVVDFNDTTSRILRKHSEERHRIWKEQGFNFL